MSTRLPPVVQRLADQGVRAGLYVKGYGSADHGSMIIASARVEFEVWVFWRPAGTQRRTHRVSCAKYDPRRRPTTRQLSHRSAAVQVAFMSDPRHQTRIDETDTARVG